MTEDKFKEVKCLTCFFKFLAIDRKPCIKCHNHSLWKPCKKFNYRVKIGNVLSQVTYPKFYAEVMATDLQERLRDFDILVEVVKCENKLKVKLVGIGPTREDGRKLALYIDENGDKWALLDESFQACIGDKNFVEFSSDSNAIYLDGYKEVTHVNGQKLLDKRTFLEIMKWRETL